MRRLRLILLTIVLLVLVWSGIGPHDRATWFLEVGPVLIGVPLLVATYRKVPLTGLAYFLLALHAVILMVGGHYTYARVPLFDWIRDSLDLTRNHYDRVGHFAQGFVPAIVTREVLLRFSPLRRGKWLAFLVVSVCLAISASYELLEWLTAAIAGSAAEDFLGTQGDVWDTQKDMLLAAIGAIIALAMLGRRHDRSLAALDASAAPAIDDE